MSSQPNSQLDDFFADDDVRWLLANARENRALTIAFPKEINISNLFAWLLSPHEGHGLGDLPIKELLFRAWDVCADDQEADRLLGRFRPALVHGLTFSEAVVVREYAAPEDAGRVDLVLVDPKNRLVLAVENKYGAKLGLQQLTRYADALEKKLPRDEDWQLISVMLDYDTESEADDQRWLKLDYEWVIDMIKTQLGLGLLSQESAATLQQFSDHLEDEGLVPYARLTPAQATDRILQVALRHADVLAQMKDLRKRSSIQAVDALLQRNQSLVTLEYTRHRKLWDYVLEVGARAHLLVPVKQAFPHVLADLESSSRVSYFTLPAWQEAWSQPDPDDLCWPIWAAFYESGDVDRKVYIVTGDVFPERCKEDLVEDITKQAKALRKRNGMKAQRPRAAHIRVGHWRCTTKEEAIDKLLALMKAMDASLLQRLA